MNKEDNFKEKFKQALISTIKVISEDYKPNNNKKNESSKNINFFELDNLTNKHDVIRYRAEADSEALKMKYTNEINSINARLKNKKFVERAPKHIVEKEKTNYNNLKIDIDKISLIIKNL